MCPQTNEIAVLTLAIQKSGRLTEHTTRLLRDAGIEFLNGSSTTLKSRAVDFPLEVLYLRNEDIPGCVTDGIAHAGIVGENILGLPKEPAVDRGIPFRDVGKT